VRAILAAAAAKTATAGILAATDTCCGEDLIRGDLYLIGQPEGPAAG